MVSRSNLSGRPRAGGVLRRAMNPPAAGKITPPAALSGGSGATSRPRPKGLAGLVSRGVEAAKTGEPLGNEATGLGGMVADAAKRSRKAAATKPKAKGIGGMVADAAKRSKAAYPSTTGPVNAPRATGLAGRVVSAAETAKAADQPPRAGGVGGMVARAAEEAQAQAAAAAESQAVVDPALGGTTTEQPTRNLPRRSAASRSGRIRSEFD